MSPEQWRLDPNQATCQLVARSLGIEPPRCSQRSKAIKRKCHGDTEGQRRDLYGHISAYRRTDTKGHQDRPENHGASEGTRIRTPCKSVEQAFDCLAKIGRCHHRAVTPRFNPRKACRLHRGDEGNAECAGHAGNPVVQNRDHSQKKTRRLIGAARAPARRRSQQAMITPITNAVSDGR